MRYFSGYKTTDDGWIEGLLQGSNTIVCTSEMWTTSQGDLVFAVATDADVVIINQSKKIQVGYASLANISCLTYSDVSNILYIGVDGSGIYVIDLSSIDFRVASGDITPEG